MSRFHFQGALRDDALYIERKADSILPDALSRGELCFVLGPRQIGKSSLRHRVARRLAELGISSVHIDLNNIGTEDATALRWYYSLARVIARDLKLADPSPLWDETIPLTPEQRFDRFLREEVMGKRTQPVVIFIDEIDVLLKLPFSRDSFFSLIRSLCDARTDDAGLRQLTFCLLGVTTITALISDPVRTPFNIGQWVFLEDFSTQEARGFLPALSAVGADQEALLGEILRWTDGHPYMTQRLCSALAEQDDQREVPAVERIGQLVHELYIMHGRDEDFNLANAARCLSHDQYFGATHEQLMRLYRRILSQGPVTVIAEDQVQRALRLTGIAAERILDGHRRLSPRNRIFATVFDLEWVNQQEGDRLLSRVVEEWQTNNRQDAFVLRGAGLERAFTWARERADIRPEETEFLEASRRVAEREAELRLRAERAEQAERLAAESRDLARRRQFLIFVGGIALAVALAFAGLAIWQYREARRAQGAAEAENQVAKAKTQDLTQRILTQDQEIERRAEDKAQRKAQEMTAELRQRTLFAEKRQADAERAAMVAATARAEAERLAALDRAASKEAAAKQKTAESAREVAEQRRRAADERLRSYQRNMQDKL